jgi:alginate O-acetyltransferase complex protein AlgI
MIFTSYTYLLFLATVFVLHNLVPASWRKPLLVAASYFFYCTWDWRFSFLLLGISVFNWAYGRWLAGRRESGRLLAAGIVVNLAPLLYYKYTVFLLSNLAAAVSAVGGGWRPDLPAIILPLGISFFTFQGIAYLVDIWSGDRPFAELRDFLFFKAFWPQLIAGPIIRPHEIADQIREERHVGYDDLASGSRRILFGFFKKVVLADSLAPFVDAVFVRGAAPNAIDGICGALGFGLQIYFDFSAYSDIAIGSARLFGFVFPENFDWPYAAASPQEFWNRWHMTLSRWIRDYVFTPIRFATRYYPRMTPLWLVLAMAVCGLWHGAQWTFVAWGVWHGVMLVANQTFLKALFAPNRKKLSGRAYVLRRAIATVATFCAMNLAWVLFRAPGMAAAARIYEAIFTFRGGLRPAILRENAILFVALACVSLVVFQALRGRFERPPGEAAPEPTLLRSAGKALVHAMMVSAVVVFDASSRAFVYFQF